MKDAGVDQNTAVLVRLQEVLEQHAVRLVRPESLLPGSREQIVNAVLEAKTLSLKARNILLEELVTFVADDDATLAELYLEAKRTGSPVSLSAEATRRASVVIAAVQSGQKSVVKSHLNRKPAFILSHMPTKRVIEKTETDGAETMGVVFGMGLFLGFLLFQRLTHGAAMYAPWQFAVFDGIAGLVCMFGTAKLSSWLYPKVRRATKRGWHACAALSALLPLPVSLLFLLISFVGFVSPAIKPGAAPPDWIVSFGRFFLRAIRSDVALAADEGIVWIFYVSMLPVLAMIGWLVAYKLFRAIISIFKGTPS